MGDPNISVLSVDDEEGLVDFLQQALEREGYASFMETDGMAAVNFFKAKRPDITLIDVALGDTSISGIEVLKKIMEIDPNAVCIMLTRITDESTVARAKDLGALHYIFKPFTGEELVKLVNLAEGVVKERRASQ